ncbi:hypothetical protein [Allocoleopsis sp.]|uniref:hypothetical protein n=1 Tax=Allocoleopsis sp. TaxID=3088169 RepID=UPI002FD03380
MENANSSDRARNDSTEQPRNIRPFEDLTPEAVREELINFGNKFLETNPPSDIRDTDIFDLEHKVGIFRQKSRKANWGRDWKLLKDVIKETYIKAAALSSILKSSKSKRNEEFYRILYELTDVLLTLEDEDEEEE